jgi:hypothetical protein
MKNAIKKFPKKSFIEYSLIYDDGGESEIYDEDASGKDVKKLLGAISKYARKSGAVVNWVSLEDKTMAKVIYEHDELQKLAKHYLD